MSVAAKINAVMADVCNLGKDGKMDPRAGGYGYLSEEKVVTTLHAAMEKHGLVVVPVGMEVIENRVDTLSTGKLMYNTRILSTYRFIDSEDGDFIDVQALGEGSDVGDKTLNKCMTGAFKYILRQSFMISTGEDPDHSASQETTASQQRPAQQQPRPAQQTAAQRNAAMAQSGAMTGALSDAQLNYIEKLLDEKVDPFEIDDFIGATLGGVVEIADLTKVDASKLIEVLKAMPARAA